MAKLKRFVKGSKAAKRYMAQLRSLKAGKTRRRKRTYHNGLYHHRRKKRNAYLKWLGF